MFRYHIQSKDFEDAVKKIAIAIPSNKQGAVDCIQMSLYKKAGNSTKSIGIFLAFNAKIEAISTMEISDVEAEEETANVYISGNKLVAAAAAFGVIDTVLEITLDKELCIAGAGSKVSLQLGDEVAKINPNEQMLVQAEMETDEFVRFLDFASSCYQDGKGMHSMNCVGIRFDCQNKRISAASSNGSRAVYAEKSSVAIKRLGKENEKGQDGASPDDGKADGSEVSITVEGSVLKSAIRNLGGKSKLNISTDGKRLVLKKGTYVIIILTNEQMFPFDSVYQIIHQHDSKGAWKAPIDKIIQALSIYEITMEKPWLEITTKGESQVNFQGKDELTTASVTCAQQGDIPRIVVDEKQFKDAVNIFASKNGKSSEICVGVSDENQPVSIRKAPGDPNCIIVLPIVS